MLSVLKKLEINGAIIWIIKNNNNKKAICLSFLSFDFLSVCHVKTEVIIINKNEIILIISYMFIMDKIIVTSVEKNKIYASDLFFSLIKIDAKNAINTNTKKLNDFNTIKKEMIDS